MRQTFFRQGVYSLEFWCDLCAGYRFHSSLPRNRTIRIIIMVRKALFQNEANAFHTRNLNTDCHLRSKGTGKPTFAASAIDYIRMCSTICSYFAYIFITCHTHKLKHYSSKVF